MLYALRNTGSARFGRCGSAPRGEPPEASALRESVTDLGAEGDELDNFPCKKGYEAVLAKGVIE